MDRSPFMQQVCCSVLATLVLWTPFSSTVARAQERLERIDAKEVVQAASQDGVAHGIARERLPTGDAIEATALAGDLEVHESALDPGDSKGEDRDPGSEPAPPESENGKNPQGSVTPLILPSGPSKTAVTPQQISLPKGEGSIEGMGESFTPNLSSGTGTFRVPIALPKGRAGVQPSLALSYATSGGDGVAGIGWSLAVPFISRQTDKGLPRYVDQATWHREEDIFMYNGGQELVPIDSALGTSREGAPVPEELSGWQQYRARVEGGFMRFFRAPDSMRWVVQSKDGTRFDFGSTGAVVADPEDPSHVFSWQLFRMSDAHGSTVHYRYTLNAGTLYPDAIYYTSPASCASDNPVRARGCAAPLEDYAHRVQFVYEARQDVTSSYLTTWRVEQALRLKRLEMTSAGDQVGARFLVRRYHLGYDPDSYHSLLSSVQVEGRPSRMDPALEVQVGSATVPESSLGSSIVGELLPPMRFGYTKAATTSTTVEGFGGIDATVHKSASSPDHSASEGRVDLFDVNSDGLPDLLVTDPAVYRGGAGVYFNGFAYGVPGRAGDFSAGVRVNIPSGLSGTLNLSNLNTLPMDVDGDGRVDVLHMPRAANYSYFVLSKQPNPLGAHYSPLEGWSFHHVSDLLPPGVTDPRIDLGKDGLAIKTLDVNNDHLIDVVRTTGLSVQTWLNLGRYPDGDGRFGSASFTDGRWTLSTLPVESCLPLAGQRIDFSASGVRVADMNGDGLQDIAKVTPDSVVWWPGRGEGAWGDGGHDCGNANLGRRELRMANPPQELNAELAGLHLVDINEDGATDLVQVGFNDLSVWFNQGGTGFTDRILVKGSPTSIDALDRVRIADIDGSATTDIIYADAKNFRWIDPMGGVRPRLLNRVDNGLGALTTLAYSSSSVDYLRDLSEAATCDPADLDCFTWQREPVLPGEREGGCDARVLSKRGGCVHRAGGSPVISTVVRSVSTSDRLSALGAAETVSQTEYRYHDGYYEGIEQEFRGFGAADAVAIGDEYEPTSHTRTYFHQGRRPNDISADRLADNPNEALKGREFLTEVSDESGKYLKTSHATYAVRALLPGLNGVGISYAYVKASDELRYDTVPTQRPSGPTSLASVVREQATAGLLGVLGAAPKAGDAPHIVPVRHAGHARIRTTIDLVDNVGNLREQAAWGRGGRGEFSEVVADERVVTHTEPVRVDDSSCGNTGWLWRTGRTHVTGADPDERYGDTQLLYDQCGNQTQSMRAIVLPATYDFGGAGRAESFTQGSGQEVASARFDAWGQPLRSCGGSDMGAGAQFCLRYGEVQYDSAYGELVTRESIQATSSLTLSTSATWDRGLGVLNTATDPNGYVSEVSYDGLGRLTATLLPNVQGCGASRVSTTRIQYQLTSSPASQPLSRVRTLTLLSCSTYSDPDSQIEAYAYVDGLGRPRVALAEGESDPAAWEDGRAHAYTKSGLQAFTKKGQVRLTFQPSHYDGSPDDFRGVLAASNVPYARASYDAFGRPTLSINEDGSYKSISYHALSADVCDEVDNGASCVGERELAGTCTTERTDGHGRTVDQQLRQRTRDGTREQHRLFSYYRPDGAMVRVVRGLSGDNVLRPESGYAGLSNYVERRFIYDSLGRRIASEDPDTDDRSQANAGLRSWRYLFNDVGDLVAVRDPRGCGQNFYYDLAGRLVGEAYVGCAEAQLGEVASSDVPVGSVAMGRTTTPVAVHARYFFDEYPGWAAGLVPSGMAAVLGRATGGEDRAQRLLVAYDLRGNAVFAARQLSVIPTATTLSVAVGDDGRPRSDGANEAASVASANYDATHTYTRSATFDHAGRVLTTTLPVDPDYAGTGTAPVMSGRMQYYRSGAPKAAELGVDGTYRPVVQRLRYTRDGLPAGTVYGDEAFTGRRATETGALYDARRRPIQLFTSRTPAADRADQTLGDVTQVMHQRLSWDGSSNLCSVDDRRLASEWPAGHKPYSQTIYHDALYRVASVHYDYQAPNGEDSTTAADGSQRAPDWRDEEARHRAADPMRPEAAKMVSAPADRRVIDLEYSHDWLANMTDWTDDATQFYERSLGQIVNGNGIGTSSATPALRPAALYLASNLKDAPAGEGGYVELDYGRGGNVLAMTVHGQCSGAGANSCADPGGTNLTARRDALRTSCVCDEEQHYVYRWDELNRLHEARRYDRADAGAWVLGARQRYRYDAANQRTVKQSFEVKDGASLAHRVALYVYPGDFERRGLVAGHDRYLASGQGTTDPVQGGTPPVVISQVYGAGGNTGSSYRSDFVELFNRSASTVSLSGWSLQYASAAGTGSFGANGVTPLSGSLAPGQYLLMETLSMGAAAGKVALVDISTRLACNGSAAQPCSAAQTASIVDLVGYGTANYFEGSAAAPAASSTNAVIRANGGCIDTNDNRADFVAAPAAPRNSASARNVCPSDPPPSVPSVADYNDTETQYLIAGARVVWSNRTRQSSLLDPDQRITFAVTNLIQSTSAVIDLTTGELVEAGGFYPNGAREEQLGADDALGGAAMPLEPVGFTGKEADEEVGLTYFGERYLIQRIGRWATPDPLHVHAMGGGEAGNSYHYVSGNLLQARDPLGLEGQGGASFSGAPVATNGTSAAYANAPAGVSSRDVYLKASDGQVYQAPTNCTDCSGLYAGIRDFTSAAQARGATVSGYIPGLGPVGSAASGHPNLGAMAGVGTTDPTEAGNHHGTDTSATNERGCSGGVCDMRNDSDWLATEGRLPANALEFAGALVSHANGDKIVGGPSVDKTTTAGVGLRLAAGALGGWAGKLKLSGASRRIQNVTDVTAPSGRAARRQAMREHGMSTSQANNFERVQQHGKNPNLRGPNGEASELIRGRDLNGNPVEIQHHNHGHYFADDDTFELPHYHGSRGHISYE